MTDEPRPQPDPRLIALARDLANLPSKRELAWKAIQQGNDPRYVGLRYGFSVEEMERAKLVHEKRKLETKREG